MSESSALDERCAQYLRTQLVGDRRAALQMIDALLRAGVPAADVRFHVVGAAQLEIGRLWQQDRISVAQEHMATNISQLALAHLFHAGSFGKRLGRKVIVACVPGEQHEFPARLLSDTLEVAGYEVRFLGADVPIADLLTAIEAERPDVIALSVTMSFHLPALREVVGAVRARAQKVRIAVGGHAFSASEELAQEIGVDLAANDAHAFVERLAAEFGASL